MKPARRPIALTPAELAGVILARLILRFARWQASFAEIILDNIERKYQ